MRPRSVQAAMRRGLAAVLCLSVLAGSSALVGCGSIRVQVPEGRDVRLLQEDEPASFRETRRIWFWLWGNSAISDITPIPEIEKHDLREIRVDSKQTVVDTLLNMVGGIVSIVCRTMVVEGNP